MQQMTFGARCRALFCAMSALLLAGCLSVTTQSRIPALNGAELPVQLIAYKATSDGARPTVLIAHGSDGPAQLYHNMAQEILTWGFNAVVIDHYTLRGIQAPHTGRLVPHAFPDDRARDMLAAARWVEAQPWHRGGIGVIGASQGGSGILALIDRRLMEARGIIQPGEQYLINATVAFYPGCTIVTPTPNPALPTQLHLGDRDNLGWIARCGDTAHPLYERHVYAGATHAWDVSIGEPRRSQLIFTQEFNPEVTRLSRQRAREFFQRHFDAARSPAS
jgi:dienelactone hydrolase